MGGLAELYINLVFSVGIGWYFLGIYHTDNQRKTRLVYFGIKILVGAPLFPQKGGIGPLLEELSPPFENEWGFLPFLK
jgi:hypothetical protein